MKHYIVEFTHLDGTVEEVELKTDRLEWYIEQWSRNRAIASHKVISENSTSSKKMLFG